jgi:hypothetical protein
MQYVILKNYDHYAIVNDDADFIVGRVHPLSDQSGFRVTADLAPDDSDGEAGTVHSLGDAIPALAAYYERHRPKWQHEGANRYIQWTQFALLRVEQDRSGSWVAYRDDYPLLRMGAPATFPKRGEAQRAAETHVLDCYPGYATIDDGLSWLADPEINWRSCPHRVEDRAHWQRMASHCLP